MQEAILLDVPDSHDMIITRCCDQSLRRMDANRRDDRRAFVDLEQARAAFARVATGSSPQATVLNTKPAAIQML